jgi:hypothetical protein
VFSRRLTLSKYCGRMLSLPHCFHEARNVLGLILSIGVHHYDCFALTMLLDVGKSHCYRSLMAEVAPQH